jgi:acyl transferase domain-containing protein
MTGGNNSAGVAIVGIACRFPGAAARKAFEDAGEPVASSARPVGVFTGLGEVVSSYLSFDYPSARNLVNSAPHVEMTHPRYPRRSHDCFIARSPQN